MEKSRIVAVQEIIPEIKVEGLVPLEDIAQEKIPKYEFGTRTQYGLADYTEAIRQTILDKGGKVEQLRDQVLVDLGAGAHADGFRIAEEAGARAYIGVEPHFAHELYHSLAARLARNQHTGMASVANDDMLTFLKRLPSDSVSILMAGIDSRIIRDEVYIQQVGQEIARVLHPKGAYICDVDHIEPRGDKRIKYVGGNLSFLDFRNIGIYVKD